MAEQAALSASRQREEIGTAYGAALLEFVSDRDAEAWSPLFAILAVADPDRLQELRVCAENLTRSKTSNAEDDSLALQLLADIRQVWPDTEPKVFVFLIERPASLAEEREFGEQIMVCT